MKRLNVFAAVAFIASLPISGAVMSAEEGSMAGSYEKLSSDFGSLDKNGDNNISKEEASENAVSRYFVSIDANSDSNISEHEYSAFIERYPSLVEKSETEEAE